LKKKETSSTKRGGTGAKKGEANKEKGSRVDGQKERKRKEDTGLDEVDEDERDRRNVEDIQRRMYARKAAKELERSCTTQVESDKSSRDSHVTLVIVPPINASTEKNVDGKTTVDRRNIVKTGRASDELTSADVGQQEAARQWAEEDTSNTSTVIQSTCEKGSTGSRAVARRRATDNKRLRLKTRETWMPRIISRCNIPPSMEAYRQRCV